MTYALRKLEQSDSQDPIGFLFLSLVHLELGDLEAAERCYGLALDSTDAIESEQTLEFEAFRDFVDERIKASAN